MTASTTTTIRGVSIFSGQRGRRAEVFDLTLSPQGIVIRRPGRGDQHLTWERITQWEIQEGPGCVVLTLHGEGSVTPLMIRGWTLDDLKTIMREATAGTSGPTVGRPAPAAAGAGVPDAALPVAGVVVPEAERPGTVDVPVAAVRSRTARRHATRRGRRRGWRPLVTIVLLGLLAAAVVLVLLQSAGVISWSFLGPTA